MSDLLNHQENFISDQLDYYLVHEMRQETWEEGAGHEREEGVCWTSRGEWNSCWLQWPDAEAPLTWSLMCWYIFCLIMFFVKLCRLDKIWCEQRPLAVEDCQKEAMTMTENREDVTREDEDSWCQKQVQVLNVIFRPVGKIILSLSWRQSTSRSAGGGGLQQCAWDSETSCKDVQNSVQIFH